MYFKEYEDYIKLIGYDDTYVQHIRCHLKYCKEHGIDPLSFQYTQMNQEIADMKNNNNTPSYINVRIYVIRFYYKFLHEKLNVYSEENLQSIKKVERLKVPKQKRNYLTAKEIDNVIADGMTYFINRDPIKVKAILLFMFYTGLRIGEIENLRREDIDLKEMKALIRIPTKNKEERYTYFPIRVKRALEEYFIIEPEKLNAFNMSRKSLWRMINRLNVFLKKSKKITPHSLRHSFANLLAEQQIGIRVAQKLLGHKSMSSTLIYYDPDSKLVEKIYRDNIDKQLKEYTNEQDLGPTKTL